MGAVWCLYLRNTIPDEVYSLYSQPGISWCLQNSAVDQLFSTFPNSRFYPTLRNFPANSSIFLLPLILK